MTEGLPIQLENALNEIGCSMMSDDFAAKLLAFVLVMGGEYEEVTHHKGLNAGIQIAQRKFNIYGGEIPYNTGCHLIGKYSVELADKWTQTEWLNEIARKYDLRIHKG